MIFETKDAAGVVDWVRKHVGEDGLVVVTDRKAWWVEQLYGYGLDARPGLLRTTAQVDSLYGDWSRIVFDAPPAECTIQWEAVRSHAAISDIVIIERGGVESVERWKTLAETREHIHRVGKYLRGFCTDLLDRMEKHDESKLRDPELATFVEFTPKLKHSTYGSDEYRGFLEQMKPALEHHYKHNRHHPEHHYRGVDDMTLGDVVEMFCDWCAAVERHDDGDIAKSIEINRERFGISDQLCRVFENTAREWRLLR